MIYYKAWSKPVLMNCTSYGERLCKPGLQEQLAMIPTLLISGQHLQKHPELRHSPAICMAATRAWQQLLSGMFHCLVVLSHPQHKLSKHMILAEFKRMLKCVFINHLWHFVTINRIGATFCTLLRQTLRGVWYMQTIYANKSHKYSNLYHSCMIYLHTIISLHCGPICTNIKKYIYIYL